MKPYNPKEIEPKWRKLWTETKLYSLDPASDKEPFYTLEMFPYPSGDLHTGHWYAFTGADLVARFAHMQGKKVLFPMGFDSFGLPAENAAIKRNIPPATWTRQNIESMSKQVELMGSMLNWESLVVTSDPQYYHWTQWIFAKLFESGLAYRAKRLVNWCPKDCTVLANEQVVGDDNLCERCDTPVVQKELEQWFFKITDYAEELLTDLENLDWPERVKIMQRHWIGKSVGAEIDFAVKDSSDKIAVFTTRADTIFSAAFIVLAPEHPLVNKITTESQKSKVTSYVEQAMKKTELDRKEGDKDKTGIFTGSYAVNPANDEAIPIWIGDFVIGSYGSGAVFGDIHDERDFEFIQKYDIPAKITVVPEDTEQAEKVKAKEYCFTGEGILIDSGEFTGMSSSEGREKITAWLSQKDAAREKVNYKLRDWLVSRQRYWGAPIPVVYCDDCGTVAVPYDQLPVLLPEDVEFEPTGQSPLQKIDEFVNTTCPNCGKPARRETDTLDTFVDSSWYFLRYPNPKYDDGPYDPEAIKTWLPVDHYLGGIEHAILHLLYARFITKALADHAQLPFREPFKKLTSQGIILGPDGNKMSKSRGNVVNPDEQVEDYGADTFRLYLMFLGPYTQGGPYDVTGITGVRRFLERVWVLTHEFTEAPERGEAVDNQTELEARLSLRLNQTIRKLTQDLQELGFNTAIAALMELTNDLYKLKEELPFQSSKAQWQQACETLLVLLAPFAPHISEELWQMLGHQESVHTQAWPSWQAELIEEDLVTIVVQVNGKLRANLVVPATASEDEIKQGALEHANVAKFVEGKDIKKVIYVPKKLVNFVVS